MDTKLACLIQGVIGVFFGLLALRLPEFTLTTFLAFFWLLLIGGILVLLFLAITAKSEESIFFFMISAALVFVGVGSFFFPGIVAIIFISLQDMHSTPGLRASGSPLRGQRRNIS